MDYVSPTQDYFGNLTFYALWLEQLTGQRLSKDVNLRRTERGEDSIHPPPVPWSVAFLVAAVSSKAAAVHMTNSANNPAAQQIIAAADNAIAAFIDSDDICPPWPWPGPPPWLSIIASELTFVASTLQEGSLRSGLLQLAGQVLDRAQALSTTGTPGLAKAAAQGA
jgi:hypothetical protein